MFFFFLSLKNNNNMLNMRQYIFPSPDPESIITSENARPPSSDISPGKFVVFDSSYDDVSMRDAFNDAVQMLLPFLRGDTSFFHPFSFMDSRSSPPPPLSQISEASTIFIGNVDVHYTICSSFSIFIVLLFFFSAVYSCTLMRMRALTKEAQPSPPLDPKTIKLEKESTSEV